MNPQASNPSLRTALLVGTLAALAPLTGCGIGGNFDKAVTSPVSGGAALTIGGRVHGGNQPVVGASVRIYVAGVNTATQTLTGYGSGATPLSTTVTTDANGNFSIPVGNYTCPTPAQQAYIVASGGNPGLAPGTTNPQLVMMAALGTCPAGGNLTTTTPIIAINEVTTVAAVWALQQFMAAPSNATYQQPNIGAPNTAYATGTSIGSVTTAVSGLNNAFTTAKIMADISTGSSPNTNYAYATPETAKINTIANILAYCVNSGATVSGTTTTPSSACSSLFAAATPTGAAAAQDTVQAAWYIAQNPINNLPNLYNFVAGAGAPFLPDYLAPFTQNSTSNGIATNAFNDATIAINYAPTTTASIPAVSGAYAVAIDAYGNAWLSNSAATGTGIVSAAELGPDGSVVVAPTATYTVSATGGSASQFATLPTLARTLATPKNVAIDLNNRAWITNEGDNAAGTAGATPVAASTGTVGVFAASTAANVAGTTAASGYLVGYQPWGIAIDGANNVYVSNTGTPSTSVIDGRSLAKLAAADGTYTYSTSAAVTGPNELPGGQALIAVDTNTNGPFVNVSNYNTCKVIGTFNAVTPFGTISQYVASTDQAASASEITTALSNATTPGSGTTSCASSTVVIGQSVNAGFANPFGIAVDRNNGMWLSDVFTSSLGFDGITYLAAPTSAAGLIPTSTYLVNGVLPTSSTAGTAGTTLTKAGANAVDGNNNVWIANQTAKSVVEASIANNTITLLTPGQGGNLGTGAAYGIGFGHNTAGSTGIAIDPSGNVWITNASTGTYTNQAAGTTILGNSVTVVVGAAGPVITPLALAVKSSKLGSKP